MLIGMGRRSSLMTELGGPPRVEGPYKLRDARRQDRVCCGTRSGGDPLANGLGVDQPRLTALLTLAIDLLDVEGREEAIAVADTSALDELEPPDGDGHIGRPLRAGRGVDVVPPG